MIVRRFYDQKLAQTSYLIGCVRTGSAVVIDPNRDVEQYVRAAAEEGVAITLVTETHIHADFVSGVRELAHRMGATVFLSDEGDQNWKYAFAQRDGAMLVRGGDSFEVGNVRVEVVHTPGHTPEHVSFLVTDAGAADEPIAIVTGDFVFVGDVGRPDLLEKAARIEGTMEHSARTLFRSLQRFKRYPDWLQIWPGHGAGSACGKGLSAVPHSTVGYERRFNWAFGISDEDEFVRAVLAGQPEPPRYFAVMKQVNKSGPRLLGGFGQPERLSAARLEDVIASGMVVIDTRPTSAYATGHIPGTINIPLNKSFTTRAGWLVPYDRDIYLIAGGGEHGIDEAVRDLAMIGLDRIAGYFGPDVLEGWTASGRALVTIPQITGAELADRMARGDVAVLDVRGRAEWAAGHIPGVHNIPLGYLTDRLDALPRDLPLVVQCQSGARSAIAASVLRSNGVTNVMNLIGGFAEWEAAGHPVERSESADLVGSSREAVPGSVR